MARHGFFGRFTLQGRSLRTGRVLFERPLDNGVKLAALDYMHRAALGTGTVYTTCAASLILDSGYTGHQPTDTRLSHAGWTDLADGGGSGCMELMARNGGSNGQAIYQPSVADRGFVLCPNNTYVRGVSFYFNVSSSGTGYQLNPGSLLFSTAVVSGSPLYVQELAGSGETSPPATVAVAVGYVLSATPFDP